MKAPGHLSCGSPFEATCAMPRSCAIQSRFGPCRLATQLQRWPGWASGWSAEPKSQRASCDERSLQACILISAFREYGKSSSV